MEKIIEASKVHFIYPDGTYALKDIELKICQGEFIAIIGQNGSGKTTLVKHFIGLYKPTKGKVIVKGIDTRNSTVAELARYVGYVFQNPDHQIFSMTVFDEVSFGLRNLGLTEKEISERVKEVLKQMQLSGKELENPLLLSKGEKQRLAVASVLAMQPEVLILDEPTTGQDWKNICILMDLVSELNQKFKMTVIIITHNMHVVTRWTKRTIIMTDGRIILDVSTREAFANFDILKKASITPPQITRLASEYNLGYDVFTIKEFIHRLFEVNS
ncbi:MAG: energy-coupling factor ABC transporter ATP-binding protein [Candidatus Bathyarchaeia archaeon]